MAKFGRRDLAPDFSSLLYDRAGLPYDLSPGYPGGGISASLAFNRLLAKAGMLDTDQADPYAEIRRAHLAKVAAATGMSEVDWPENFGANDTDMFANLSLVPDNGRTLPAEGPVEAHIRLQQGGSDVAA